MYSHIRSASPTDYVSADYKLQNTGGIVGQAQVNSTINRCRNYAYVSSNFQYVGGIAGQVSRTSIYNVVNYGKVESFEGHGYACAAGIAGYSHGVYDYVDFYNCINHGDVVSKAQYDIATAAGIAMELTKCYIANCYSDGSVSAQRVGGTATQAFTIPQYECADSEIRSSATTPDAANAYIATQTGAATPLLQWYLNNDKSDLRDDYLTFPVARHGDCNIYIFPKEAYGPFYITYTSEEDGISYNDASSSSIIYLGRLLPDSHYSYQVRFPQGDYVENNVFDTAKPTLTFSMTETSYDRISFAAGCDATGVTDIKAVLTIDSDADASRVVTLPAECDSCVADNLEENCWHTFRLVYTLNGKEFGSTILKAMTLAVRPKFSLQSATPYSLTLKCDNYEELKRFSPGVYLDKYLIYTADGPVEAGPKSFLPISDDGIIVIDSLQYDYAVPLQSQYVFRGETRHRELSTERTTKWGGEGIIQLSPTAAMVHGIIDGVGSRVPDRSCFYEKALFTYRDALSADSKPSVEAAAVPIDGKCDFAATIPLDSPLFQFRVALKSNTTYYGNYLYKNGNWTLIDVSAATVDVVEPRFFYPVFANKELSISLIVGEEHASKAGLEYQIEGPYPANDIVLAVEAKSQRLGRGFSTLVPGLSYLFRYYLTTDNGKTYHSDLYRVKDGVLEKVTDPSLTAVSKIPLSESKLSLLAGTSATLQATVLPGLATCKAVEWTSNNPSVATVTAEGLVEAKRQGRCVVSARATDGTGVVSSCEVTVVTPVSEIVFAEPELTIAEGQSVPLAVTVYPATADDKSLQWSSGDTSILTVDEDGTVTALRRGTTTVTAKAKDGSEVTASCSIRVIRLVSSITLNRTELTIDRGYTWQLTAQVAPADADIKELAWKSSDPGVVSVDATGQIEPLSPGFATITANASDGSGVTASCEIEVIIMVKDIILSPEEMELKVGDMMALAVTVLPEDATYKGLYWSTWPDGIVTVDDGLVTALAVGEAVIFATASDYSEVMNTCRVQVAENAGVASPEVGGVSVRAANGTIIVRNIPADTVVRIFQPGGMELYRHRAADSTLTFTPGNAGVYFVIVGSEVYKVVVK